MGAGPKGKGKEKERKERKKPGRIPTSCAECRRLKLKCDKNIPCSKCVSRGCAQICPDVSLAPGKGGRLILANTEELHDRIDVLASRNRELENALRKLQEGVSDQPHPLLRTDLLRPNFQQGSSSSGPSTSSSSKSPSGSGSRVSPTAVPVSPTAPFESLVEDGCNVIDTFGTLSLGRGGESSYCGISARPEFMMNLANPPSSSPPTLPRISTNLLRFSQPEGILPGDAHLPEIFTLLPSRDDAARLCEIYLEYGKFLYHPLPRDQLVDGIIPVVYRHDQVQPFEDYPALSLLFIVLAIATLFDHTKPAFSAEAHEFYHLSHITLKISQPFRNTTLTSLHTFIHTAQYLELIDSDDIGTESAWTLLGNASRLSYAIGLHLNASRWKLHDELSQHRHNLFWRLFVCDTWTSFYIGRPPSISESYIDCPYPRGLDHTPTSEAPSHDFHSWNTRFAILLHSALEKAFGPKQLVYPAILDIDRKIRDFSVPTQWRLQDDRDTSTPSQELAMYRWLILSSKEIVLLNLHKAHLIAALHESPADLHRNRFLPSVVAIYRSAWRLIRGLVATFRVIPHVLARVKLAWSHGLSAGIALCLLVTRSPTSHLVTPCLKELDSLASLFDHASSYQVVEKLLPFIQKLQRKAREVLGPPISRPYYAQEELTSLDVEHLSGRTRLVSADPSSLSTSTTEHSGRGEDGSRATSVTMSDGTDPLHPGTTGPGGSTSTASTSPHEHENIHLTLANDLKEFVLRSSFSSPPTMTFYDHPSGVNSHGGAGVGVGSGTSGSSGSGSAMASLPSQGYSVPTIQTPNPSSSRAGPSHHSYTHSPHLHPHPYSQSQSHYHSHSHSHSYQQSPLPTLYPSTRESPLEQPKYHLPPPFQPLNSSSMHTLPPTSAPYTPSFPPASTSSLHSSSLQSTTTTLTASFGSGMSYQSSFSSGLWGIGSGGPNVVLDSSWGSFVEQLGF